MKIDIEKTSLLAKTIRMLSVDAIEKANSGHPGMPMGAADYTAVLWNYFLHFDPKDPEWLGRDYFVLSAGHGSMLLYSLLHLFGYELPMSELENFRQWGSKTPGHPEFGLTPGVATTTGPLGQGFGNAVGIALSQKLLAEKYSPEIFRGQVFGVVSDGDLMEGISSEAASIAGHLGLGNLVFIYDDNHISIGGNTSICFSEDVAMRFQSCGWYVQKIDGHDIQAIADSLQNAVSESEKPSIIIARTTIGFGSPNKSNTSEVHGSPLGKEEREQTRKNLNWPISTDFYIPDEILEFCAASVEVKSKERKEWDAFYSKWSKEHKSLAAELDAQLHNSIPAKLEEELEATFSKSKKDATRNLSGQVLQVLAKHLPFLIGGSADLEPSTKTLIKGSADIKKNEFTGRNIRFGVREHAMGAIANGLAYTKLWIPYTATFMVFSDYMRPTIRLAALSHLQVLFIFTHDSFWVGEDGPTHQPIEQAASLRLIPNTYVFRPADGLETAMCYLAALKRNKGPSALLLTRQNVEPLVRSDSFKPEDILKGAYIVANPDVEDLIIVATGSEVSLCIEAVKLLENKGLRARVVSMPCVELFLEQGSKYIESILPKGSTRVCVEAGVTTGWEAVVGSSALIIGLNHFGASAPGEILAEKFGFSPESVAERIEEYCSL
ncbi:MAG: transketolase [SAR324 cluster bacterium]|uniref:Transketolase n=1 Tax=SAR324 cluster bacterium TaxID=2024889 RepID=A0A7X9IJH8_9DELT|nr:transketolase [SAR324 cluster bacterium]